MIEGTVDPAVYIIERGENYVVYWDVFSGEKWRIDGKCSECGACLRGAAVYQPAAQDCPVRPEISENEGCTLTGYYL